MDSSSERERILLGYVPRDPFTGAAVSLRRNSDVDFHDVFGGPPRRSSIYEPCGSRAGSIDSCRRGLEESVESRRSHLLSGEKPVFGDGGGSGRRRQLGDDFFSDIFQTYESGCSSPRRGDRDLFLSSAPGSKALSPNRPTSLRCETMLARSVLLPHASQSVKSVDVLDYPAFASLSHRPVYNSEDGGPDMSSFPSSPNALSNGFTTQFMAGHSELRSNTHVSYTQSLLPRQIAFSFESLSENTDPTGQAIDSQIVKTSSSLETYISNGQFHFSIYKWAGKGVMLVMPSFSKETNGYEGKVKNIPEIIVQEFEVPTHCDYFSFVTKFSETKTVIQESKSANDNVVDRKEDDYITTAEYLSAAESDPKILQDERNEISGSGDIPGQAKESVAPAKDKKKQQLQRDSPVAYGEPRRATMIDTPSFSENKTRGHKVKGKVKEFIKKFSQEVSPKKKGTPKMLDSKSRGKDHIVDKMNILAQSSSEADKLQTKSWNNNIPLLDVLNTMENEIMETAEEDKSSIACDGHMIIDLPSEERNETIHPSSETTLEVIDNAAWDEEIIHEEIEGSLVQQLSSKETEEVQNSSQQDQIKCLDNKIREWSKGKERNIRSLLSTLQYVLWPESGWKQVPLVDIVEGSSVKKAYQRALLFVHPDKLQQKGASSNQKYIAENVFNILQEAWDQFNSIGQF